MKNNLNVKIVGAGPTGLLLSIALSKLKFNIYLTDLLSKEKLINKEKTYAITHSSRIILEKFNLWTNLKPYLYGFDTISINDSETSKFTNLSISDLDDDIRPAKNIGWVVKHNDLMNVFFDELDNNDNIFFKSQQNLSKEEISFDYQFFATGANSLDKKSYKYFYLKKTYNQSCLAFKVQVRGNEKRRAYEIFRKEGPLALLPLDKNLYQIIWTSSTSKAQDRLNSDKNFLMDNLSTILPENFKLDQIVGELSIFPVYLSLNLPIFNLRKLVLVGDLFHTFHPVGGQGLNTCWRDVYSIFNLLKKRSSNYPYDLNIFKFKYYLNRFIDILVTSIITDSLITIFANRNLILFPLRKLSFFLLNKFLFIRKFVLNQMTKSVIFSFIK